MISALIGLDPTQKSSDGFSGSAGIILYFQDKGFFSSVHICGVIHHHLYTYPISFYREMKNELAQEANKSIEKLVDGQFKNDSVKVLQSDSHLNESLVEKLCNYGMKKKADVLLLSSTENPGAMHWILGSFCETAALVSSMPVLIIKPQARLSEFAEEFRILIAVDVNEPMTDKSLRWIAKKAAIPSAMVELIYVEKAKSTGSFLRIGKSTTKTSAPIKELKRLQAELTKKGIKTKASVLKGGSSISQSIVDYADNIQASLIITETSKRSRTRRILLGSTSRSILRMTKRPFLNLRF